MLSMPVLSLVSGLSLALSGAAQTSNPGKRMHLNPEVRSTIESYYQELESRKGRDRISRADRAGARQTAREKTFATAQDYQSEKSRKIELQIGENRVIGVFLKHVEKKAAVERKTPEEDSKRTPWERFQATTVTGTVEGDENSSVVLVLTENGLEGSVNIPSEKTHFALQGVSVSAYHIKEMPASTLKCGATGNAK